MIMIIYMGLKEPADRAQTNIRSMQKKYPRQTPNYILLWLELSSWVAKVVLPDEQINILNTSVHTSQ